MFLLKLKYIMPLAILAGLLATVGAYSYLQNQKRAFEQNRSAVRPVVQAKVNVPGGTKLEESHFEIVEFPARLAPEGSFSRGSDLINRVTKSDLFAGEVILESRLASPGSGGGVSAVIPPGMRAMTVAVNVVSGVGGFILPHARVDVLATVSSVNNKEESITATILENIEVLAVDQTVTTQDDDPMTVKSVTLLVNPTQAEKLALAGYEGKLQLVLRNGVDQEASSPSGVRLGELINREQRPLELPRRERVAERSYPVAVKAAPAKESPKQVVEVYRSSTRSEVVLDESKSQESKPLK